MGAYMCIAANGIPPTVSKTIRLGIDCENKYEIFVPNNTYRHLFLFQVPPMMWVPDQQVRALRGGRVTLACFVESHPEALTFWHHAGRIIQPRGRFSMHTQNGKPSYKVRNGNNSNRFHIPNLCRLRCG